MHTEGSLQAAGHWGATRSSTAEADPLALTPAQAKTHLCLYKLIQSLPKMEWLWGERQTTLTMKTLLSIEYLLPNLDDMIDCTKAQETANFERMFGKQTGIKASFLLFSQCCLNATSAPLTGPTPCLKGSQHGAVTVPAVQPFHGAGFSILLSHKKPVRKWFNSSFPLPKPFTPLNFVDSVP